MDLIHIQGLVQEYIWCCMVKIVFYSDYIFENI
jgi:hypothetical protein